MKLFIKNLTNSYPVFLIMILTFFSLEAESIMYNYKINNNNINNAFDLMNNFK